MGWERCIHGYNIIPGGQRCPWCNETPTTEYAPVLGKGNGWLLGKDDLVCEGCGGPRKAGWGAWAGPDPPTAENVREALSTMRFCYQCTCEGKSQKRSKDNGDVITDDEMKSFSIGACPDCGKYFHVGTTTCPRLTCGSRFRLEGKKVIRDSAPRPDEPPRVVVTIEELEKR